MSMEDNSLLKQFYFGFYPIHAIKTWWKFFSNHKRIIDEVLNNRWDKILKPVPFFTGMYLLYLMITIGFNNYTFTPTWVDGISGLNNNELDTFYSIFNLAGNQDNLKHIFSHPENLQSQSIRDVVGSIELDAVAEFLEAKQHHNLSAKFYKEGTKLASFHKLLLLLNRFLLPIAIIFMSSIVDYMLRWNTTPTNSKFIVIYFLGFMLPIEVLFIDIIPWYGFYMFELSLNGSYFRIAVMLAFLLYSYSKLFKVFQYVYNNTGKGDILVAFGFVHLVIGLFSFILGQLMQFYLG